MSHPKQDISGKRTEVNELAPETRNIWEKMTIFKQRFKDNVTRVKSLEENLTQANFELTLLRNENSRLSEKLGEQSSSISKYQKILKDLVDVEDRYCKAVVEKKRTDEELASEKKLRLELQNKWASEKSELEKSLQHEIQILRERADDKEKRLQTEWTKIIEEQKLEIATLRQRVTGGNNAQEELARLNQELASARKEIAKLKNRPRGQESLTIVNNVMLKPTSSRDSKSVSRVGVGYSEALESVVEESRPKQNQNLLKGCDVTGSSTPSIQGNSTCQPSGFAASPNLHGSQSAGTRKCNSLEVFRVPSRIQGKSQPKRKRKLYSRTDDTI